MEDSRQQPCNVKHDVYVYIEHVVEVDPQVEEDPTMEGDGDIIWESSQ